MVYLTNIRPSIRAVSADRERVIIESSILAVTVLFIIAQIREEFKSLGFIVTLLLVAILFVISAMLATLGMWPERVGSPTLQARLRALAVAFFFIGLVVLLFLFVLVVLEFGALLEGSC